jgi:transcriptional regulator with XRE-family HTH domain
VDRVKVGNTFRAIRVELLLRQADVAAKAGVSQQTVSNIECGRIGGISVDTFCRVAEVMDADVALTPRWRGPKLDRLIDRRHALIQNRAAELLMTPGWVVRTELSFNQYGDRGSVDVLGWLPSARALVIVEVKTEITDLEETLRILDMKRRIVPGLARRELGWQARAVAAVLVMPDATTHRALIERHSALVSASLPARTVAIRNWLAAPVGDLSGVWFLRDTSHGGAKWRVLSSRRVRAISITRKRHTPRPDNAQTGRRPPIPKPEQRPADHQVGPDVT